MKQAWRDDVVEATIFILGELNLFQHILLSGEIIKYLNTLATYIAPGKNPANLHNNKIFHQPPAAFF